MDKNSLWESYRANRSAAIRNQLLIEYAPLVRRVVHALPFTFMGCADEDDMIGEGIFGLMDAIDKYDARRNVKFETYASLRIRGAVLDKLRKMDVLSRGTRERVRQIEEICDTLEKSLMRHPTHAEIAQAAGLTEQAVRKALEEAALSNMISLEDVLAGCGLQEDARTETPEQILERSELTDTLTRAIEDLRDNEKQVVSLYYYEELTLREIGAVLGVSESRASQLLSRSLRKLRQKIAR
ncbi:MAG: FliA/WhiG family RNA polymerase sigma factor [Clostridiales bacterium]|nr:FliA/WhiG family RNA polymerase sigma factor [Clostridiales bacterium]